MKLLLTILLLTISLFSSVIDESNNINGKFCTTKTFNKEKSACNNDNNDYDKKFDKSEFLKQNNIVLDNSKLSFFLLEKEKCYWCEKFHKVIEKDEIKKILKDKFNVIFLDKNDKDLNKNKFNSPWTPTVYIFQDDKLLLEQPGYMDNVEFKKFLNNALKSKEKK